MKNPLRHIRFSLTGLFGATLFAACVAATLRYATRLWADTLFTLVLITVAVAALGALYRKGAARAFWLGALVGSGGYLFLAYGPWIGETVRPHLVTTPLLSMAYERLQMALNPPSATPYGSQYVAVYNTPTTYYTAPMATYGAPPVGGSLATVSPMPNSQANSAPSGGVDPYSALPQAADASTPPDGIPPATEAPASVLPDGSPASQTNLPSSDGISGATGYNYAPPMSSYAPSGAYDPYAVPPQSYQVPTYQPIPISTLPDWDNLDRAGHSLTALLVAFVFGITARWFNRTRSP
ncbi:MAG TPA: hypothetical protein VJ783_12060, partial [Pirellulales bacterium]|nr:hypothetical protein [Pirellulales bacterium]